MIRFALYLFGSPRLVLNGAERYIRRRKGVALLAYLAVTQLPHSRDTLATLFWPEFDQTGARDNLRRTLSELHQTLDNNWLMIDRTTIRLRDDAEPWVDLWQFHQLLAACQQHGHAKDQVCSACLPLLQQAVELYHDDFLAGFTLADSPAFDDWQAQTSAEVRAAYAATLARLVDAHVEQRDDAKAVDQARRWVALDPLHEAAQRRLMELYARSNQRAAALRQYEECRQVLADELAVSPAPETTALYEQIREHAIGPDESMSHQSVVIARPRHNLPTQTTSFIGREEEVAQIKQLLLEEAGCRLLNLIGPGGIGKTRLALAAAAQMVDAFPDGAYFVSLAAIGAVTAIVPTIAEVLHFTFYGSSDPQEQLLDYLSQKKLLLVIDNYEHLLAGAELLSTILREAPHVTLLATARERLRLQEEWVYEVQGLTFPADDGQSAMTSENRDRLGAYSAVQLFIQRARQFITTFAPTTPELAAIGRICQLVGGMPLAVELASPWIRTLRCEEIATEIERSLDFLTTTLRNTPTRHQSLQIILAQTWDRLSLEEQSLLMQLAVFHGGCTREAAQTVTGATLATLSSLMDKALLWRTNIGRYELHELLRQYAKGKLEIAQQVDAARNTHCAYYVGFLQQREADLKGRRQVAALDEIEADFDNVRAAWQWAVSRRQYDMVGRALETLYWSCDMRNRYHECLELMRFAREQLAPNQGEQAHPLWGRILALTPTPARVFLEPIDEVRTRVETALTIAQAHGKQADVALCLWQISLAVVKDGNDLTMPLAYCEQSLACYQALGDHFYQAHLLDSLGIWHLRLNQTERGAALIQQSAALRRAMGDKIGLTYSLNSLGWIAYNEGRYLEAEANWQEAHQTARETRDRQESALTLMGSAWLTLFNHGNLDAVQALAEEVQTLALAINSREGKRRASILFGFLAGINEEYITCREFMQQTAYQRRFTYNISWMLMGLCLAACGLGEMATAAQLLRQLLAMSQARKWTTVMAQCLPFAALLKREAGEVERAVELLSLALSHPVSPKGWLKQWPLLARLQTDLATALSPVDFAKAWQRGQTLDLETTAQTLLD